MTYQINWHPQTREFLQKCDKTVSKRIVKKVNNIKDDPILYLDYFPNHKLFKLRVGDYRVLMDINQKTKILEILFIDHRSKVYKKL